VKADGEEKSPVPKDARAVGVETGDIIVGIDGLTLDMTVDGFLGYVRQNRCVGDRSTFNLLRNGQRVNLPNVLK
jgi:hypothetical protein